MLRQKIELMSKEYSLQILFSLPRVAMKIAQKWVHEQVNIHHLPAVQVRIEISVLGDCALPQGSREEYS